MESLAAPKTFVDQAYAVILDAICHGTLKPGERLTQESVARRLNVSRQPVHNALLVLKAQGFVRDFGRRGLAVAPLDPKLFESIYQFRSAIEPLAVRLAIPFLTAVRGGETSIDVQRGDGKRESLVVKIPPGVDTGTKLRLKGQGEAGPKGTPAGDMTIEIAVEPHPYFKRDGRNLQVEVPVSVAEAVLGAAIKAKAKKSDDDEA